MTWYWTMIGAAVVEAAAWLGRAVAATENIEHPGRVWARAARLLAALSTHGETPLDDWADTQVALRALSDEVGVAPSPPVPALQVLQPMVAFFSGDIESSQRGMEDALRSPDGWIRAAPRIGRAGFAENEGELDRMREDVAAAFADFQEIGDRWGLSSVLSMRGTVRSMDDDVAGAIEDYEQAMRYAGELGSTDDDTLIQLRLAGLRLRAGDPVAARSTIEAVRDSIAERSQGFERGLFADGVLTSIVLLEGDLAGATALAEEMRVRLAERPLDFMSGHAASVVGATTSQVAISNGDLDQAMRDLTGAYPTAIGTQDMPIVAAVGVSVACLADALGRPADAAEVLGAAARLRGSPDHGDPIIRDLTDRLRTRLGAGFDCAFDRGRLLDRSGAIGRINPAVLVSPDPDPARPR